MSFKIMENNTDFTQWTEEKLFHYLKNAYVIPEWDALENWMGAKDEMVKFAEQFEKFGNTESKFTYWTAIELFEYLQEKGEINEDDTIENWQDCRTDMIDMAEDLED